MARFNNDKKTKADGPDQLSRLVEGAEVVGNIRTRTSLRIDGIIQGNVACDGKIVLGSTGKITGDIECAEAEIEGRVEGNIQSAGLLCLRMSCFITGNISAANLVIENRAEFNGNCSMKLETASQKTSLTEKLNSAEIQFHTSKETSDISH